MFICSNQPYLVRVTLNSWQTCGPHFRINLEFGVLVFEEVGKQEKMEKESRDENQRKNSTPMWRRAQSGNRTRATAVGGEG